MKTYKPRIADKELQRKLAGIGAVLIEGPKWCVKPRPLSNRKFAYRRTDGVYVVPIGCLKD